MPAAPEFQDATQAHRAGLRAFTCAPSPYWVREGSCYQKHIPEPWSSSVQEYFHRCRPPFTHATERMVVKTIREEIAAVGQFGEEFDGAFWRIDRIAVSIHRRRCGIARRLVQFILDEMRAADSERPVLVYIHQDNVPSQQLFESLGFYRQPESLEDKHETWTRRYP